MKKKIETNQKLINHIMNNGKKKTSEKQLFKSIKNIQKESSKQFKKLLQLAILNSTPVFKLHRFVNKKQKKKRVKIREIPAFISNKTTRNSLSIKFILTSAEEKKSYPFYQKLKQEILLTAQNKSNSIELKNNLQKQILLKKHFFKYYRWK